MSEISESVVVSLVWGGFVGVSLEDIVVVGGVVGRGCVARLDALGVNALVC